MHSLIAAGKLNDVDLQAWLVDVFARIAFYPSHRLDDLLTSHRYPRPPPRAA